MAKSMPKMMAGWAAALAGVLVVAWLVYQVGALVVTSQTSRADRADLREQLAATQVELDEQQARLDRANRRLIGAGKEPVDPAEPVTVTGLPGLPGLKGLQGLPGMPGPRGPAGDDGLSVKGDQGAAGDAGPNGADGATGATGADGAPGKDGQPGKDGATGPAGPTGPAGSVTPGTYACTEGEYLAGFTVATDGTVTLTCRLLLPAPVDPTPLP